MLDLRNLFRRRIRRLPANQEAVDKLRALVYFSSNGQYNHYDEVHPSIFLGDGKGAKDLVTLESLGVTHILNAACGSSSYSHVNTDEKYYEQRNFKCCFMGVPALDHTEFDISVYFYEAAEFIDSALQSNGKVYVHCLQGVSRSAALVIAYLMIKLRMSVQEAIKLVRKEREIHPNDGFLAQLSYLDTKLKRRQSREKNIHIQIL